MKILDARVTALSNLEVYGVIQRELEVVETRQADIAAGRADVQEQVGKELERQLMSNANVVDYLRRCSPMVRRNDEASVAKFLATIAALPLDDSEVLQIVNLAPCEAVSFHGICLNLENRLTDEQVAALGDLVRHHFWGGPALPAETLRALTGEPADGAPAEDSGDARSRSRQAAEQAPQPLTNGDSQAASSSSGRRAKSPAVRSEANGAPPPPAKRKGEAPVEAASAAASASAAAPAAVVAAGDGPVKKRKVVTTTRRVKPATAPAAAAAAEAATNGAAAAAATQKASAAGAAEVQAPPAAAAAAAAEAAFAKEKEEQKEVVKTEEQTPRAEGAAETKAPAAAAAGGAGAPPPVKKIVKKIIKKVVKKKPVATDD
eukprot:TRINITY_DN49618_c0_g1_i1.p1 TRINITY_DN49618_c0_g1~~TRINITY_DN49618_c0_g1_i1.p1  ORF type:complete len:376 (-),score=148.53 TRINITY_DN49618_c0_g1_i1:124-1251(-)